jgi:septal ring factor EnvC (AmiA/AmiB activator)
MSSFFGYVPTEFFMYGAIGFLAAWLMALMCFPAVHHRAQRLLRKRYDELPLSIQEMRAEKDQIRAGFATATRDLEVSIGKLKEKTAAHATELAKKVQLIERLKKELETLNAALTESGEREREARGEMLEVRKEFGALTDALEIAAEREHGIRAELRETRRELALKDSALDAAGLEVSAIKTEIARIAPLLLLPTSLTTERSADIVPLAPVGAPHRPQDDGVLRAWTEIDAAARRVDARYDGTPLQKPSTNQHLRAAYAPASKPVG